MVAVGVGPERLHGLAVVAEVHPSGVDLNGAELAGVHDELLVAQGQTPSSHPAAWRLLGG